MSAQSILINVGAKTASAVSDLNKVNKALGQQMTAAEKASRGFKAMAVPAAAAATALAGASMVAINAASQQEQAFGALDSVFKSNADSMKAWADEQAAIGLSATEASNAAALFGAQFKNAGLDVAEAAKQSQALVGLGADLAATFGGPTTDAVDALSAAFKGEFDSLEKYGVSLKASDVAAKLAAKGQSKLTGAAKKAAEQAAINEILWEQTADAQGQAGREADTTAGRMATMTAEVSNLTAELGQKLLPYAEKALQALIGFTDWASRNQGLVTGIAVAIGVLAGSILLINGAMAAWSAVTAAWTVVTTVATAVGGAFAAVVAVITSPIFLVIAAIVALIAVGVLLWKNWDRIGPALARAWQWIKDRAVAIFNAVKAFLIKVWDSIVFHVKNLWTGLTGWLSSTWTTIKDKAVSAFTALKQKVAEAWEKIKSTIRDKATDMVDYVRGFPGRILSAIGNLGGLLYGKGRELMQGFINGIKDAARDVPGYIWDKITPFSLPGPSAPSVSGGATTFASGGNRSATINFYGSPGDADVRVIKRALEGYDIRQGRPAGAPLRVAW